MSPGKMNVLKKPWLWACVTTIGLAQIFTVATSPYDRVKLSKRQPSRVPAAAEPIKSELTPAKDEGKIVSSPDLQDMPAPAEPQQAVPLSANERVIVMSWNVKALAREGSDYDRAALVLADADIVVLHDMDLNTQGKGFLNVIGELVEDRAKQKFCRAWTQAHDGTRLGYGILWRESMIGYMEPNGLMHEDCGKMPFSIRQGKRLKHGVHAAFYSKNPRKMFELAAVTFDKKPRISDVNPLFQDMSDKPWPVVVAGDYKSSANDALLRDVSNNGYRYALDSGKRSGRSSHENFWYRNGDLASSGTVNLYQRFGDSRRQDIEKGLSDQFPIAIELRTKEISKEELTSQMVAKSKSAKKESAKKTAKAKVEKPAKRKPNSKYDKKGNKPGGVKASPEKEESIEDEASNVEKTKLPANDSDD